MVKVEGEGTVLGDWVCDAWTPEGYTKPDCVCSYKKFQASWSGIHGQILVYLDDECDEDILRFYVQVAAFGQNEVGDHAFRKIKMGQEIRSIIGGIRNDKLTERPESYTTLICVSRNALPSIFRYRVAQFEFFQSRHLFQHIENLVKRW